MATRSEPLDKALNADSPLRRLGSWLAVAGDGVALYGTVFVLVMIGGLKFTAYEADAIRPLVDTSPLLSWAYAVFSPQGFSNVLGVVKLATALFLALTPFAPRLGLLGGAGRRHLRRHLDLPDHRSPVSAVFRRSQRPADF